MPLPLTEIQNLLPEKIRRVQPLTTTSSHPSFQVQCESASYFLKHSEQSTRTFLCEANGLREIAGLVPCPRLWGATEHFILMDLLDGEDGRKTAWEGLASALAYLHSQEKPYFGFHEDNFIGLFQQKNLPTMDSWPDFFWHRRIEFQISFLKKSHPDIVQQVVEREGLVREILGAVTVKPVILHGDLWDGNVVFCKHEAHLIDPAIYFGHSETDLAMTQLFGGFPEVFYNVYWKARPQAPGWPERRTIYQLYHLLNHLNIFGGSYRESVLRCLRDIR